MYIHNNAIMHCFYFYIYALEPIGSVLLMGSIEIELNKVSYKSQMCTNKMNKSDQIWDLVDETLVLKICFPMQNVENVSIQQKKVANLQILKLNNFWRISRVTIYK